MSSNHIVYTDDEQSDGEEIFQMEDVVKKSLEEMNKDELLEIIKKDKENKKRYIRKYQQTDKGKMKTREASKKYYDANRAKILEKKRLAYLKKKEQKMMAIHNEEHI